MLMLASGEGLITNFLHLAPVSAVIVAVLIRMAFVARQSRQRRIFEAARLATMLAVELQTLADHYADNLDLLRRGGGTLLSLRSSGAIYRGNANRMAGLLSERVLAPVVAAHAHHERIEALLQIIDERPAGRRVGIPRQLPPPIDALQTDTLRDRFDAGRRLIQAAIDAIAADWPRVATGESAGADSVTQDIPYEQVA